VTALVATSVMSRPNEPPQPEPLAYFLTWPTYGTWLPGDSRGWVEYRRGWRLPDPARLLEAAARMTEDACYLDSEQRQAVHDQIAETCCYRGWELHAVNCRTNHIHVVVTAPTDPKTVRNALKAWCTRRLRDVDRARGVDPVRENYWAERGSQRYINDDSSLEGSIIYTLEGQDIPR
jgi:REP element-mobilizing transposase RayT